MALDPKKKFLYFNKDETSGEMDAALCFPVSRLAGIMVKTSTFMDFHFDGSKGTDATIVRVTHEQYALQKAFMIAITDEINFGEKAFIRVIDQAERSTLASDVTINMLTDVVPTFTLEDNDLVIADAVSIGGNLTFDSVALTGIQTSAESFSDDDVSIMTSAAIQDKILSFGFSSKIYGISCVDGDNSDEEKIRLNSLDTSGSTTTDDIVLEAGTGLSIARSGDKITFTNTVTDTQLSQAEVEDIVGAMMDGTETGISVSYDSTNNNLDFVVNDLHNVGVDGSANQLLTDDGDGTVTSQGGLVYNSTSQSLTLSSGTTTKPSLFISNSNSDAEAPLLALSKSTAGADGDDLGRIQFDGFDPDGNDQTFVKLLGEIVVAADGSEEGKLTIDVASHDGELQPGLIIASGNAEDEVDVTVGNGATSLTTTAGNLAVTGKLELGHADDTTFFRESAGVVSIQGKEIITEGKVNVASEAQAPIGMQIARRTITTAEANAMNSTPIELIPAQGANTIIEVSNVIARVDRAATQTNSSADMNLHYADKEPGTFGSASISHFRRFAFNETTDFVERRGITTTTSALTLTEDVNKAVEVSFDAATTTNCFTSIDMYVTYFVIDRS